MCVGGCGQELPIGAPSSICRGCQIKGRDEDDRERMGDFGDTDEMYD